VFRDVKSLLETRPVFHQNGAHIAGHVVYSFLALVLRTELDQSLATAGHRFEWLHIKQDLEAFKQVVNEENGKRFAVRNECKGNCGKVF
jgi:transposase